MNVIKKRDILEVIGVKIQQARKEKGYTQEYVAEKIEKSVDILRSIENGRSVGSVETLLNICNLLEITLDYIFSDLLEKKEEILDKARDLCIRIKEESNDPKLIKEIVSLEALSLAMANKPVEILELLGEDIESYSQDAELIGLSFQLLGNVDKADEVAQICMYQHLIALVGNAVQRIVLNTNDLKVVDETFEKAFEICKAFDLDELHSNIAVNLYLSTAQAYAVHGEKEKALDLIEMYTKVCVKSIYNFKLKGNEYFDKIEAWFKDLDLGVNPPRSQKLIKQSVISALKDNPVFASLKEEYRFKFCLLALESE